MPKYVIKLCDYPFDSSYENVLRFDTNAARDAYFTDKVYFTSNLENFNAGNLVRTSQRILYTQEDDLIRLLNAGYCYIENTETLSRLYYFITESVQESGRVITLSLQIDVFQTYYNDVTFSPCMIDRAHLDRYSRTAPDAGTWRFRNIPSSALFTDEDFKPPQRMKERWKLRTLYFDEDTGHEALDAAAKSLNDWLNAHVRYWVYYFLVQTSVAVYASDRAKHSYEPNYDQDDGTARPYMVFCYPVMDDGLNKIKIQYQIPGTTSKHNFHVYRYGMDALSAFDGEIEGFRLTIKLSGRPPFHALASPNGWSISGSTLTYESSLRPGTDICEMNVPGLVAVQTQLPAGSADSRYGLFSITKQTFNDGKPTFVVRTGRQWVYTTNELKNIPNVDPKLRGGSFETYRLTAGTQSFDYDPLKLGKEDIYFYYDEGINPGPTQSYCRYVGEAGKVYTPEQAQSLMGLVGSQDNTVVIGKDVLKTYVSNNKNFYQQHALQVETQASEMWLNMERNVTRLKVHKMGEDVAQYAIDYNQLTKNFNFSVDNMRAAPDQIENVNGSPAMLAGIMDMGIYLEHHACLDGDLDKCADYMNKFGYKYGRTQNLKVFDHNRTYWNYIQAYPDAIQGRISETVHQTFQAAFAHGVRFWHDPERLTYNLVNYERSLDA